MELSNMKRFKIRHLMDRYHCSTFSELLDFLSKHPEICKKEGIRNLNELSSEELDNLYLEFLRTYGA